jgi:hypothetical protein
MRKELQEHKSYGLEQAVAEVDSQISKALSAKNPNHMAAAKLLSLKCELYGLLTLKYEVTSIDIGSALAEAKARSQGRIQIVSSSVSLPESYRAHDPINGDIFS